MIPAYCTDEVAPAVCCDTFHAVATSISTVAYAALVDCAGADLCEPVEVFVSAAEPHLMMQDYIAVWPGRIDIPVPKSTPAQAKGLLVQQPVVPFTVKLKESGFPTIGSVGTEVHEADVAAIAWASKYFLAHTEAVMRGVVDYLAAQNPCGTLRSYGGLTISVSGGAAVAQFSASVEVPWRPL